MGSFEKIMGTVAALFWFTLIGIMIYCFGELHKIDESKSREILRQHSVIIKLQTENDSLKKEIECQKTKKN